MESPLLSKGSNSKDLILLTRNYPYGSGEEFLQTEINYLSKYFDHVVILSRGKEKQTRLVPKNVHVSRIRKLRVFERALHFSAREMSRFFKEVVSLLTTYSVLPTFAVMMRTFLFVSSARHIEKIIQKHLAHKMLKGAKSTFLYSYWCDSSAMAIANCLEKNKFIKGVCRAHGWDVYWERSAANFLPFRKHIAETIDRIYFVSEHGKKYFEKRVGQFDSLEVSRLGVDAGELQTACSTDGVLRIVSCSNFAAVKRLDLLVKSLAEITDIEIAWTHIGGEKKSPYLLDLASHYLTEKSNISFEFPGHLPNKKVYEFYQSQSVDVFINLSSSEGIPVSMMEALSFGIPIIATSVGGVPELVDGSCGVLLTENPSSKLVSETIQAFHKRCEIEKKTMRTAAFLKWQKKFSAKANHKKFAKMLTQSPS